MGAVRRLFVPAVFLLSKGRLIPQNTSMRVDSLFGLSFVSTCGDDRLNNSFSLNTRYTF